MKSTFLLMALSLLLLPARSQASNARIHSGPYLGAAIDAILDDGALKMASQGIVIRSLTDGATLYERNGYRVFLPASNNKLLTSAAALHILGPDFVYYTRIYTNGNIGSAGVLDGDIVLRGAGDPLLTDVDLNQMAQQIVSRGVRRITGRICFDDSLFDRQWLGDGWTWDDEPFYYSAQISALNVNENAVEIQCTPASSPGAPLDVNITPTNRYVKIVNNAHTTAAGARPDLHIGRMRGLNVVTISGSLPIGVSQRDAPAVEVTVENPSRYAATVLAERLKLAGVQVEMEPSDSPHPEARSLIAEHLSPPLCSILKRQNKPSDNLVAECLLKTVGASHPDGNKTGNGALTARNWFLKIGLKADELQQADGSGLSRSNLVSPDNVVTLLAYLRSEPGFSYFYDSLPIAGVDGTLRNRLRGTPAQNNCHAKTGSLSHVSCLSGYVNDADGRPLVFSILMNNFLGPTSTAMRAQDRIVALLAGYHSGGSQGASSAASAARP